MGYGTLQETRSFGDGTAIDISVAKVTPEKQESLYDETGIKPEFAVEYAGVAEISPENYANTYDSQYKKAVEGFFIYDNAYRERREIVGSCFGNNF